MNLRYPHLASLALRIGFSLYMALGHGLSKLQHLISGEEIRFPSVLGLSPEIGLALAVFSEFIACIFILIGYKTRLASIPVIITMFIAGIVIHSGDTWFIQNAPEGQGSKELALVYLFGFLGIFLLGPGKYSVDDKIKSVL